MIITDLPLAGSAQSDLCDQMRAGQLHVTCTSVIPSPDKRWQLVIAGDDNGKGAAKIRDLHLPQNPDERGFLVDARTQKVVYRFEMERSAWAHWLPGGKILIVNYFQGSGTTMPLVFALKPGPVKRPVDLSKLVYSDIIKRIHHHRNQVYHYYVNYVLDEGQSIIIGAEPWFVKHGNEGEGDTRCYLYRVDKATFRHFRFIREVQDESCPANADERWD